MDHMIAQLGLGLANSLVLRPGRIWHGRNSKGLKSWQPSRSHSYSCIFFFFSIAPKKIVMAIIGRKHVVLSLTLFLLSLYFCSIGSWHKSSCWQLQYSTLVFRIKFGLWSLLQWLLLNSNLSPFNQIQPI